MNKKFKNKDNTIHGISLPLKGWGYYKYRNVQGKEETLIVKKNPFNTYSVLDKNGNVIKITDLQQYLQTLGIVLITGYSELGEMSNKTAKLTGNMIQNLDERHLNDVLEKSELNAKNVQHSKTIQDLEERGRQQDDRLDELYGERFERRDYFNKYLNSEDIRDEDLELSIEDMKFENIMMSLRTIHGLDIDRFYKKYGCDLLKEYEKGISQKEIRIENGKLICTNLEMLNHVLLEFMK